MINSVLLAALLFSVQSQAETAPAQEAAESTPVQEVAEQGNAEATAEAEAAANKDEERVICRRTAIVGSKFKKRICGTKKEWETLARRSSDTTKEFQNRGVGFEPTR